VVNSGSNRTRSLPILSSTFSEFLPVAFTRSSSGSPAGLRRLNVARVFETVRINSPITRQLIGEISGLSKPTVNEALDILQKEKLILLTDAKSKSTSGRPGPKAQQITFNKDRKKIVAIDIGGSNIRLLVSDLDGNIISTSIDSTPVESGRKAILSKIKVLYEKALVENKIKPSDIGSIVAGSPGTIDPNTGEITRTYNLPDWENFSLSEELSILLKKQVHVENEAHLAIYGEHWRGGAKDLSNAAAMSVGVGIGLGLLINGQVYRGFNGIAGEVGNLPLQIVDKLKSPTSANFEFHASAVGLERNFEAVKTKDGAKDIIKLAGAEKVPAKAIYKAAANGNKLAIELVNQQLELLSRGIASVCCITNPEVFILEGGLAPALEPHLKTISKMVQNITLIAPRIVISELKDLATAYGALRRGIENVDRATLISILQETA
jgi:predicted NBD/HSP70 family sugar kinase